MISLKLYHEIRCGLIPMQTQFPCHTGMMNLGMGLTVDMSTLYIVTHALHVHSLHHVL